jgi:hypothetical protein
MIGLASIFLLLNTFYSNSVLATVADCFSPNA